MKTKKLNKLIKKEVEKQLSIYGVVKPLPKKRPNTTSTLYPVKRTKCFWCGNRR